MAWTYTGIREKVGGLRSTNGDAQILDRESRQRWHRSGDRPRRHQLHVAEAKHDLRVTVRVRGAQICRGITTLAEDQIPAPALLHRHGEATVLRGTLERDEEPVVQPPSRRLVDLGLLDRLFRTRIDDPTLAHKIAVIKAGIALNQPDKNDPIDVLAKVGGFEIGGIAGLILGAAATGIPVVVDGFISTAGALDTLLDKVATYKEKTEDIKKKIKKALFYPAAVMVVAVIVTIILLIFVIPQFESLFKGFGADLPAFTRMVIDLSAFVQTKGWLLALVVGGGIAFYIYTRKRSEKLREYEDRVLLKLPIVGNIIEKAAVARFARTLSTMFSAGVPLVEALQSVAGATGNIVYEKAVLAMRDEVSTGQRLQRAMENTGIFPNMVIQMIAVGEESGSLDQMSAKVADFYEADVDNAVDSMSSLLEPLIMAILGVLVGGLVIAMYLPIFKLGSVV